VGLVMVFGVKVGFAAEVGWLGVGLVAESGWLGDDLVLLVELVEWV
jgi:hypothetical protein